MEIVKVPIITHKKQFLNQLPPSGDSLFIAELSNQYPLLIVANNGYEVERYYEEISFFNPKAKIAIFPHKEILPYERMSPTYDIVVQRFKVLWQLLNKKLDIIIVQASTLQEKLPPVEYLISNMLLIKVGDDIDLEIIKKNLISAGYSQVNQVYETGEFAIRGSVIDILLSSNKKAIRIELFDNEVEALYYFDPTNHQTLETVKEIEIIPTKEYANDTNLFIKNFKEAFPKDDELIKDAIHGIFGAGIEFYLPFFFSQPLTSIFNYLNNNYQIIYRQSLQKELQANWQDINKRYELFSYQYSCLKPSSLFIPENEILANVNKIQSFEIKATEALQKPYQLLPNLSIRNKVENPFINLTSFLNSFDGKTIISVTSNGRLEIIKQSLNNYGLKPVVADTLDQEATFSLIKSPLKNGFIAGNYAFITEEELYKESTPFKKIAKRQIKNDFLVRDLAEIKVGDLVVHANYGIGKYIGLTTQEFNGLKFEMLELEYQNNAKLFIPINNLDLISRYTQLDQQHIDLTKLGTKNWNKIKEKAEKKVTDLAAELLELYSKREVQVGTKFTLPAEYNDLAHSFGYKTTIDQQNSIDDVIRDLTNVKPMDRLICGDVGFGKTEVAIRAAFITVMNGYQVAVLVPTTLLTEQHFETFTNRFAGFPIMVAEISRFRTKTEISQTLKNVKEGKVDILIGTHRLLQKDIKFNKLGLIIIDEEHRFGVKQKENLKQLRTNVHILSMTATPIPRTLSMALEGIRDFSIINTPPLRRLPIKTIISKEDNHIIKEAVNREIRRGGQVFILYNEVANIENVHKNLTKLFPDLRIAIAHGQMKESDLEHTIRNFINRRYNILLCSTIIETGIDIPNANTIIIYQANKLGLAQLHQLRGRVGRSYHQAYCYLLIEEHISSDAAKRLEAIKATSALGGGFHLAMHDLEIRGAGEILGENQSGNIKEVGLSLYTEMLKKAIARIKNNGEETDSQECEVNLNITAILPEEYCYDVNERLIFYKRLAKAQNLTEIDEIYQEIIDTYGLPPNELNNLIVTHHFRLKAIKLDIKKLEANDNQIIVVFNDNPRIDTTILIKAMQILRSVKYDGRSRLIWNVQLSNAHEKIKAVKHLFTLLNST